MLTDKEIEVLKLRKDNLTQIEVGRIIGISQAAVSGFEKNAIKKIQEAAQTLKLAEELKVKTVRK